ncbi:MAG: hypothetical protein R6U98_28805 [Pirellulaceae bacterium]
MEDQQQSSLELLLDTITNTFGGILFLAMLVVILLQLTSNSRIPSPPDRETQKHLQELENDLIVAEQELDGLREAYRIQKQLLEQMVTKKSRAQLAALESARSTKRDLNAKRGELAGKLASKQADINSIAQAVKDVKDRLKEKETEIEEAKRDLAREVQSRTTTARLPRMHETAKREIPIVVRYDRLFLPHTYDGLLSRRRVNTDDMVVLESRLFDVLITPKPYAGTPIREDAETRDVIRKKLEPFSNTRAYLALGVWEDSFDSFIELKNVLVELGYEYRVIPAQVGDEISETSMISPRVQ